MWEKINQISHAILETTNQFFFKLYISLQCHERQPFCTFQLKLRMIFTKGAHQSAKFQTFDWSGKISPNLYFDRLLLLKIYKTSAKNVQRNYVSCYWRVMQNLKKNGFVVSKVTRIYWILIQALKSLQNLHCDWSLSCKVYNVWPKKVQRSYL